VWKETNYVKTEKKYCCQRVLYGVKRKIAANKAHSWDCCSNVGHFLCGVAKVKRFMWTSISVCVVSSLKWTTECRLCLPWKNFCGRPCLCCVYNLTSALYFAINNHFCVIRVPFVPASRLACHWMCDSPPTGYVRRLTTIFMWREQTKT